MLLSWLQMEFFLEILYNKFFLLPYCHNTWSDKHETAENDPVEYAFEELCNVSTYFSHVYIGTETRNVG